LPDVQEVVLVFASTPRKSLPTPTAEVPTFRVMRFRQENLQLNDEVILESQNMRCTPVSPLSIFSYIDCACGTTSSL